MIARNRLGSGAGPRSKEDVMLRSARALAFALASVAAFGAHGEARAQDIYNVDACRSALHR
jgi:hypothetical protein